MRQAPTRKTADNMRRLLEGIEQLPSAPASAARILAIATSPHPDFKELTAAVEADPAISIRALRLANTAGFNRVQKVEDIRQACMLLGTEALGTLALCATVRDGLFGSFDSGDPVVREYWRHSLTCATAARLLAGRCRPLLAASAFAAGLIHDCGKLALLASENESYAPLLQDEFLFGERLVKAEQEAVGADHSLAGKWLLERWGIPGVFVEAAWSHHQPLAALAADVERSPMGLMIALADRMAHEAMGTRAGVTTSPAFMAAASVLGIEDQKTVSELMAEVGRQYAERAALFELAEDAASFYFNALNRANRRLGSVSLGLAGKGRELELSLEALKRVALTGVDIIRALTPREVMSVLATRMNADFGSPGGLIYLMDVKDRLAEGYAWGFGGAVRLVEFSLSESFALESMDIGMLPPGFLSHLAGCRTRASALPGPDGPPVHFLDGVGMVSVTEGGDTLGELLFVPQAGAISEQERPSLSLLAQLAAQALNRLELIKRCEARSERLAQVMRSMQEMNDKLLKTQRLAAVGQLAAGAAHEINNPLAIISARAQLLEMREADPAKKKGLRQMVDQIERISAILGSLMDFARPAPPRMEAVTPSEVMDRVLALLEGSLVNQGITVERRYARDVPLIKADARQLEQVLLNLVLNAQHAMENGGGALGASIAWKPGEDVVRFEISDTGMGIPRENLEKVFDPFFTTKPEGKGTGLGLSTAYGIVKAHKGRISVESEPGKGTAFTVTLPRDASEAVQPGGLRQGLTERRSILVADDESHIRDILRESLESAGYEVELAEDGETALELLRRNRYRLLILDVRMPGRDGLSVLRQAASFAVPSMPVLVLTGMASTEEMDEAKAIGAASCMRKPFQVDALLAEVERLTAKEPSS